MQAWYKATICAKLEIQLIRTEWSHFAFRDQFVPFQKKS